MVVPSKCHCLADDYASTLKVTDLMLYLRDSCFHPTLAEVHVLATYVYSSSMKKSCEDPRGKNLAFGLGEDVTDVFI